MPTSSASRISPSGEAKLVARVDSAARRSAGARVFSAAAPHRGAALPSRHGRKARLTTRIANQPDGLPRPAAPYSPVVITDGFAFTAGQVGFDAQGDIVAGGIAAQTRQALENLRACLAAAGCTMDDVVKVTAFLVDLEDFSGYNEVYAGFFTEPYPARTTVGAGLPGGLLVEIEASVARIPLTRDAGRVVDLDRLEANLARWQEYCDRVGLPNRPHVKTHKCVEIAKRQIELGAGGVTCQTLYEAETMVGQASTTCSSRTTSSAAASSSSSRFCSGEPPHGHR